MFRFHTKEGGGSFLLITVRIRYGKIPFNSENQEKGKSVSENTGFCSTH